jgi:hypothetical protein
MMNIFDDATNAMRRAMKDQMDKIVADLESATNLVNKEAFAFDTEMGEIAKARTALDERERKARTRLMQSVTDIQSIIIALSNQITSGEVVTGGDTLDGKANKPVNNLVSMRREL